MKPSIIIVAAEPGNNNTHYINIFLSIITSLLVLVSLIHILYFLIWLCIVEAANDAYRSKQCGEKVGKLCCCRQEELVRL